MHDIDQSLSPEYLPLLSLCVFHCSNLFEFLCCFSLSRFRGATTQMEDVENLGEIRMLIGELKKAMSRLSVSLPIGLESRFDKDLSNL